MARGGGTGRGLLTDFGAIEYVEPGGIHYWVNPIDPNYGYLSNSVNATKYPLSYIYGLAAHTPTAAVTQQTDTGVEIQAAALGGRIAVIYGQDRVGGDIFFGPWSGGFTGNQSELTTGFGLGEGEIDSLVKVEKADGTLVNGAPGTSFTGFGGLANFAFYPGVDAPATFNPYFFNVSAAYSYSFDEHYPGLAYVAAFMTRDGLLLTDFPDLRFTVKGRKLLDPRLGVDGGGLPNQAAAWSDNAMLVLVDYFTNPYYGYGAPLSSINWASVVTIANWCDQVFGTAITNATNATPIVITSPNHGHAGVGITGDTVAIGGVLGNTAANGTWAISVIDANTFYLVGSVGNGAYTSGGTAGRKRFTINTTLRREASHQANIDFLRSHFRCTYAKTNGLYTFYVDALAASVRVFDEVDHAITNATNANPIVLTIPGHLRATGEQVIVAGVNGNIAANGTWVATVIDADTLSIPVAGNGAYIDGGAIIGNCRALKRYRTPSAQIPTEIDYHWTDPKRDYQDSTAPDIAQAAQDGTIYTRPAVYNADGCRDPGQGQSQATYLLKKRAKDLYHPIMCNRAHGLEMEMYDVCILNLPSHGIERYEGRIIRIAKFSNGEFQFDFEEYDSTIYAEVVAGAQTKPAITLPDPNAQPPQPDPPVLTQEGLDVRVDFNPPSPDYPYYGGTLITVLKAGGTTYNLAAPVGSGPLYIRGVTMGSLYTVKAYVVSALNVALISLASVTATITPVFADPLGPTITSQPASTIIISGNSTTLSVTATPAVGGDTMAYQWYQGFAGNVATPLGTATTQSVSPVLTTAYWVRILESNGHSFDSSTAVVSVVAFKIVSQPQNVTIALGAAAVLSVSVLPFDGVTYQWYQGLVGNTFAPLGSNQPTLTVSPTGTTAYWVRVTYGGSTLNSAGAVVAIQSTVSSGVVLGRRSSSLIVEELPFATALDVLTVQGADIASAATTNIGAGTGRNINITGTTTITAFDSVAAGIERVLKFAGILTLTHNGTSLILPGAANITTAAGDVAVFESLGSGNWRCMGYQRAASEPLDYTAPATFTPTIAVSAGTWTSPTYTTMRSVKIGKQLTLWIKMSGTTSAACQISLTLPSSIVAASTQTGGGTRISNAGAANINSIFAITSGTTGLTFYADPSGANFGIGVATVETVIVLEVQ